MGDVDYYLFKAGTTKSFDFSLSSGGTPLAAVLYDSDGEVLRSVSVQNGTISFSHQLVSGEKYFLSVSSFGQTLHNYRRTYSCNIT